MKVPLCDKIRIYIYTAVNGYAWQGCGEATSAALQKCVGSTDEDAAGGIRRWEVGGLNGTAIYRCHVRKGGDFAGRDSKYVALAFLPFAHVGRRRVDYAALWNHSLLAEPLARGESLDGLEIDLAAEGLFDNSPDDDDAGGAFWTKAPNVRDIITGTEGEVLLRLGKLFQSRKTELGSLSVRIERRKNDMVSAEPKYTPFTSVAEEVAARENFESACEGNATEKAKTEAFVAWRESVETLCKNADEDTGRFGHFLGFVEFAKAEKDAFNELLNDNSAKEEAAAALGEIEKILSFIEKNLVGNEDKLLDWAQESVKKQRQKLGRLDAKNEIATCNTLENTIGDLRAESQKVAAWVKSAVNGDEGRMTYGGFVTQSEPKFITGAIKQLADRLAKERTTVRELSDKKGSLENVLQEKETTITNLKGNIQGLNAKISTLESTNKELQEAKKEAASRETKMETQLQEAKDKIESLETVIAELREAPKKVESETAEKNVKPQDQGDVAEPRKTDDNTEAQSALSDMGDAGKDDPTPETNMDGGDEEDATSKGLPKTARRVIVMVGGVIAFSGLVYGSFLLKGFLTPEPKSKISTLFASEASRSGYDAMGGRTASAEAASRGGAASGKFIDAAATFSGESSAVSAPPANQTNMLATMSDHAQSEKERK